jgi:tripartite-type tricarboxylate transporter receptor subunit TctC
VSISENRKSRAGTRPIVPKSRRAQRRPLDAAMLDRQPLRVKATKVPRRGFLNLAAGAAALPAVSRIATAQVYPSRPITMIVPFAAGGPGDVVGRMVAGRMRASLGQPIIIENVGGANGNIGVGRAAQARSDGYTVVLGTNSTHVLNGAFYSLAYDVLNGFTPVSPLARGVFFLYARNTMPAKGLNELVVWNRLDESQSRQGVGGNRRG